MNADVSWHAVLTAATFFGSVYAFGDFDGLDVRQPCRAPTSLNETAYDFDFLGIYANDTFSMSQFRGKVTLVINVATFWGKVVQYPGLNALQTQFGADGFQVVGFPCNQFHSVSTTLVSGLMVHKYVVFFSFP